MFCDDAEHLLGKVGEASNLVRYTMMRDAVFMLRDLLGHSKALDVVYKFYETWDPEKALDNKCVSDVMEAKGQEKKTFILFYNGVPVFDDETFRKSYAAIVNKYGEMPIDTLKGGEIALLPEPIKIRSMISGNIGMGKQKEWPCHKHSFVQQQSKHRVFRTSAGQRHPHHNAR